MELSDKTSITKLPAQHIANLEKFCTTLNAADEKLKNFYDNTFKAQLEAELVNLEDKLTILKKTIKAAKEAKERQKKHNNNKGSNITNQLKPIKNIELNDTISPQINGIENLLNNLDETKGFLNKRSKLTSKDIDFLTTYLSPTLQDKHKFLQFSQMFIYEMGKYDSTIEVINDKISQLKKEVKIDTPVLEASEEYIEINRERAFKHYDLLIRYFTRNPEQLRDKENSDKSTNDLNTRGPIILEILESDEREIENILTQEEIDSLGKFTDMMQEKFDTVNKTSPEIKTLESTIEKVFFTTLVEAGGRNEKIDLNNEIIADLEDALEKFPYTGDIELQQGLRELANKKIQKIRKTISGTLTNKTKNVTNLATISSVQFKERLASLPAKTASIIAKSAESLFSKIKEQPMVYVPILLGMFFALVAYQRARVVKMENSTLKKEKVSERKSYNNNKTKNLTSRDIKPE